ncbi:steroid 21-hydroxylase [Sarcophilus harrisii]
MQEVVVLNSKKAIEEAFMKKWIDFSGRPQTFTSEGNDYWVAYCNKGWENGTRTEDQQLWGSRFLLSNVFTFSPLHSPVQLVSNDSQDLSLGDYTPLWKAHRKLARSALLYVQNSMEPLVGQMVQDLCKKLLAQAGSPVSISEEFSMFTCSIICFLSFGEKVTQFCSFLSVKNLFCTWTGVHIMPNSSTFTRGFCSISLPLCPSQSDFLSTIPQETMVEGQTRDLTDYMLQKLREQGEGQGQLSEGHVHMALVDFFIGGTETTASTLTWAVAFLLHHPEIQRRLQEELDQELGPGFSGSPPNYQDRARFPLLNATITEVLRLRPAAPLALPHCTKQPSSICGFDIPKDTIIIPNIFGAHHDDSVWAQPYDFRPGTGVQGRGWGWVGRDLNEGCLRVRSVSISELSFLLLDRFLEPELSPSGIPFSCGARVCLGEALARLELFLILAHLLQAFTLLPVIEGSHNLPSLKPTFGSNIKAQDFQVRLLPRLE